MHEIYTCATLTLVGLHGAESHSGLPGVRFDTRNSSQHEEIIDGLKLMKNFLFLNSEIRRSVWGTRCWTLQESLLPHHLVLFTSNQVIFACRQAIYREDACLEAISAALPMMNREAWDDPSSFLTRGDDLNGFYEVIRDFSRRFVSFDSDILKACSAVMLWYTELLDKKVSPFESGVVHKLPRFLFGLPICEFSKALCWYPMYGHSPLQRRMDFPSWSWAGWKSEVRWDHFSRNTGTGLENSGIIKPNALDRELWEQFGHTVSPVRQHFSNASEPIIPIAPDTPLLQFWTSSAFLTVSKSQVDGWDVDMTGADYLPRFGINELQHHVLQYHAAWRAQQSENLEIIVIGATHNKSPGLDYNERDKDYDSSNSVEIDLMCIEWKDNIAYRIQVCPAWSLSNWMSLGPKEKFMRLG